MWSLKQTSQIQQWIIPHVRSSLRPQTCKRNYTVVNIFMWHDGKGTLRNFLSPQRKFSYNSHENKRSLRSVFLFLIFSQSKWNEIYLDLLNIMYYLITNLLQCIVSIYGTLDRYIDRKSKLSVDFLDPRYDLQ